MKFLKEAYGQSQTLDNFVYEAQHDFETIYRVKIDRPLVKSGGYQEQYFVFEDAARNYLEKLKSDIKEYGWDYVDVTLEEIKVRLEAEELENYLYDAEEEKEE